MVAIEHVPQGIILFLEPEFVVFLHTVGDAENSGLAGAADDVGIVWEIDWTHVGSECADEEVVPRVETEVRLIGVAFESLHKITDISFENLEHIRAEPTTVGCGEHLSGGRRHEEIAPNGQYLAELRIDLVVDKCVVPGFRDNDRHKNGVNIKTREFFIGIIGRDPANGQVEEHQHGLIVGNLQCDI